MPVIPCDLPIETAIDRTLVENAYFTDSYRAPLTHGDASVVDIFFAIFGHHPLWLKAILLARHRVGGLFGLNAAATSDILAPARASSYRVGDNIGPWPAFHLGDVELIAGRDVKHLDFRLSVLKQGSDEAMFVTVSTVCRTHNWFGRLYLSVIAPFHKWGVQRLMAKAVQEGRL